MKLKLATLTSIAALFAAPAFATTSLTEGSDPSQLTAKDAAQTLDADNLGEDGIKTDKEMRAEIEGDDNDFELERDLDPQSDSRDAGINAREAAEAAD